MDDYCIGMDEEESKLVVEYFTSSSIPFLGVSFENQSHSLSAEIAILMKEAAAKLDWKLVSSMLRSCAPKYPIVLCTSFATSPKPLKELCEHLVSNSITPSTVFVIIDYAINLKLHTLFHTCLQMLLQNLWIIRSIPLEPSFQDGFQQLHLHYLQDTQRNIDPNDIFAGLELLEMLEWACKHNMEDLMPWLLWQLRVLPAPFSKEPDQAVVAVCRQRCEGKPRNIMTVSDGD